MKKITFHTKNDNEFTFYMKDDKLIRSTIHANDLGTILKKIEEIYNCNAKK